MQAQGGEAMDDSNVFQPLPFDISLRATAEQIRCLDSAQRVVEASQGMQFEIVHGIILDAEPISVELVEPATQT
jgi:hypothetical protein